MGYKTTDVNDSVRLQKEGFRIVKMYGEPLTFEFETDIFADKEEVKVDPVPEPLVEKVAEPVKEPNYPAGSDELHPPDEKPKKRGNPNWLKDKFKRGKK